MFDKKSLYILFLIFLFALIIRFMFFPKDVYFGIDQANGSFAVKEILEGHPKLIGPSTSYPGLRHGVLYYYLYAPFYAFGNGDPLFAAAFLRIVNACGIFLLFGLGVVLFNKYVGILAALFYAVSFEQTQFALYFNHPSLTIISILLMFLGLSILIFKENKIGFMISLLGLGLSIQFEFILTYLIIPFLIILITFRKKFILNAKTVFWGLLIFTLTISTFIIAEIKFNFRSFLFLQGLLFGKTDKSLYKIISTYFFEMGQIIKFSIIPINNLNWVVGIILLLLFIKLFNSHLKKQMLFLGIWFFSVVVVYFVTGGEDINAGIIQYHQNAGISLSLILFVAYVVYLLKKRINYLVNIIIILIIVANIAQIRKINPYGSMPEINAQSFMLLSDEKRVLDYIYQDASGKPFAVKGVTMPYIINTTWSYLFEWYGYQSYGYLPVWNGKNALSYPGNLYVQEKQEGLPTKRYLIIEPLRGIPTHLLNEYLREESYFTILEEEHKFGSFIVQKRSVK